MKKVALFVDFENLRKSTFEQASKLRFQKINYNNPALFLPFIKSFLNSDEEIYRIFIYLSEPLREVTHKGTHYDLSVNPAYQMHVKFIEGIQVQDNVAIEKGN